MGKYSCVPEKSTADYGRQFKKRFSILVIENREEYELCQVDTNPRAIVRAAKAKLVDEPSLRKLGAKKYNQVRFVENPRAVS